MKGYSQAKRIPLKPVPIDIQKQRAETLDRHNETLVAVKEKIVSATARRESIEADTKFLIQQRQEAIREGISDISKELILKEKEHKDLNNQIFALHETEREHANAIERLTNETSDLENEIEGKKKQSEDLSILLISQDKIHSENIFNYAEQEEDTLDKLALLEKDITLCGQALEELKKEKARYEKLLKNTQKTISEKSDSLKTWIKEYELRKEEALKQEEKARIAQAEKDKFEEDKSALEEETKRLKIWATDLNGQEQQNKIFGQVLKLRDRDLQKRKRVIDEAEKRMVEKT